MNQELDKFLAISGGIGGAKLALGLDRVLAPGQLAIVANTGDDFEHLGLSICPDIDTLLYTLSNLSNQELGWGRRDESWNFMKACEELGMPSWFKLGDRDLALHIYRSNELASGKTLSQVATSLCETLSLNSLLIPMSNTPVRTMLDTEQGELAFQEYFVKHQCRPVVSKVHYRGSESAEIPSSLSTLLDSPALKATIICPSNPFLSIAPVLAVKEIKDRLKNSGKPVVLISPIIDGESIKGPTSKLMYELGMESSVLAIAEIYRDLITHIIIDERDEKHANALEEQGLSVKSAPILMNTLEDKCSLAQLALDFCAE